MADEDLRKAGYLTKEGAFVKSWKKRWFILKGNRLAYYKNVKSEVPKGEILLDGVTVRDEPGYCKKQNCFSVSKPGRRAFYMYAQTLEEKQEWTQILQQASKLATKRRSQYAASNNATVPAAPPPIEYAAPRSSSSSSPTTTEDPDPSK